MGRGCSPQRVTGRGCSPQTVMERGCCPRMVTGTGCSLKRAMERGCSLKRVMERGCSLQRVRGMGCCLQMGRGKRLRGRTCMSPMTCHFLVGVLSSQSLKDQATKQCQHYGQPNSVIPKTFSRHSGALLAFSVTEDTVRDIQQ